MKKLVTFTIIMALTLFANGVVNAEIEELSESEIISEMAERIAFAAEDSQKDPFRPIIQKPEVVIRRFDRNKETEPEVKKEPVKVVEPVKITVTGICGNNKHRQAIINFKNEEFTVQSGDVINGVFKVSDISPDKLIVYSIKEERRHSFSL